MRQKAVFTEFLQIAEEVYDKVGQILQNVTDCYYKVRQVLQSMTEIFQLLQVVRVIIK